MKSNKEPMELAYMNVTSTLSSKYTFDNFTVNESNRFAYKVAFEVAEGRGNNYFPLYLFGESGVGKTHLLHSIGNHALSLNESYRVVYLTTKGFIRELTKHIIKNHNTVFTDSFRDVDILLLDDVNDFSGRTYPQDHLFHIYDLLLYSGKTLVVASNKPPMKISQLENRIVTCLIGGIIAEIQ